MFWLTGARFDLRLVQVFQVSLLPVMRFRADCGNVQPMRRFHVRRVVDAGELNIFDGFGEALQATAILFEKAQSRPVDLAVDEQAYQTLVSQHRRERKLSLRAVESCRRLAERLTMNASYVFV